MIESEVNPSGPINSGSELVPPRRPANGADLASPADSAISTRPWRPWSTLGWTILCIVVMIAVPLLGEIVFLAISAAMNRDLGLARGNRIAILTLLSALFTVGFIARLIRVHPNRIRDYLALEWPRARSVWVSLAILAALVAFSDLLSYGFDRPLVPALLVNPFRESWRPLFCLALIVAAPLQEEILFRGFLYKGIAAAREGPVTAVVVSSLASSFFQTQYNWLRVGTIAVSAPNDWYGIGMTAVFGLYLGAVRYDTGSLYLTTLLHAVANTVPIIVIMIQDR